MSVITLDQLAVMSVQYVQYTFDYFLDSMDRCGIHNIDLWGGSPHFCRLDYPWGPAAARRIRELRRQIEDRGMKVVIYTPETLGYPFSYSSPDRALRDRTLDYMEASMEDALEFGTDKLFLNTGCHPRNLNREDGWARTVDSLQQLAQRAERMGVTLMLEQLQPYESNLLLNLEDMKQMLHQVDSPALATCVDLVAMEVAGDNLETFYQQLGNKIQWIHYSDSHHEIVGSGNFGRKKLEGYIRTLEHFGYSGCIDLEINDSIYWEDPHTSIQQSVDYLRNFLPERQ